MRKLSKIVGVSIVIQVMKRFVESQEEIQTQSAPPSIFQINSNICQCNQLTLNS